MGVSSQGRKKDFIFFPGAATLAASRVIIERWPRPPGRLDHSASQDAVQPANSAPISEPKPSKSTRNPVQGSVILSAMVDREKGRREGGADGRKGRGKTGTKRGIKSYSKSFLSIISSGHACV